MLERLLQEYLARNLDRIDPALSLVRTEHAFPGGRIDILARRHGSAVGIELKAKPYSTRAVCVQLLNYLTYLERGEVYFAAPKVNRGVYSTLKRYCDAGRLRLYEIVPSQSGLRCVLASPRSLDDRRSIAVYEDVERVLRGDVGTAQRLQARRAGSGGRYRQYLEVIRQAACLVQSIRRLC